MKPAALAFSAIIVLAAVAARGDDKPDAPTPRPTDTPLIAPTAPLRIAAVEVSGSTPTRTPVAVVAVEIAPPNLRMPAWSPVVHVYRA